MDWAACSLWDGWQSGLRSAQSRIDVKGGGNRCLRGISDKPLKEAMVNKQVLQLRNNGLGKRIPESGNIGASDSSEYDRVD